MRPARIFEKHLIDNPEVCNFCFRKKAIQEGIPEDSVPNCVVPRLFPGEDSEKDFPPPSKSTTDYYLERDYYFKSTGTSKDVSSGDGSGRDRPIVPSMSKSEIICECGRMDDYQGGNGFPEDWEYRPKEKLEEIGRRVYHRLDEQEIEVDFDVFHSSLEEYKTSDEYDFGDYEVLKQSISDSVSVKPENA